MGICGNIAYGMVVNMLLWNNSNIPYYSNIRCFYCKKNIENIYIAKNINISVGLLQKLSIVNKTWMLLGPRYGRMGGGLVAYFKGQAFVKQGCE